MSGIIGSLLGGTSSAVISIAVGQSGYSYKGSYLSDYGYFTISYPTGSPAPSPTAYNGATIKEIGSSDQDGTYSAWLALNGIVTTPATMQMGGATYTNAGTALGWSVSNAATMTIASPGVVTYTAHGAIEGAPVMFATSGALPTGIVAFTVYYVKSPTANTFNVSATPGGAAINTTGSQSGTHTAYLTPYTTVTFTPAPTVSNATGGRVPFIPTISIASPAVVTSAYHSLTDGKRIVFSTTGALPTGLVANTIYYVVGAASGTFNLSLTSGGAAINTSGSQSGVHTCFEVVDIVLG